MRLLTGTLLVSCLMMPAASQAEDARPSPITIESPWLRATPNGASVVGGYATLINKGPAPDRLIGASIPVAATSEVHSMSMKDGVMHMERLANGLPIPAGATVVLAPGGNHLMFFKPSAPIKVGQSIKGTIVFEKAGTVPVTFAVGAMNAKSSPAPHAMSDMPGMK